jgi:hypothetical protein
MTAALRSVPCQPAGVCRWQLSLVCCIYHRHVTVLVLSMLSLHSHAYPSLMHVLCIPQPHFRLLVHSMTRKRGRVVRAIPCVG